jgi:hypothetical protein
MMVIAQGSSEKANSRSLRDDNKKPMTKTASIELRLDGVFVCSLLTEGVVYEKRGQGVGEGEG